MAVQMALGCLAAIDSKKNDTEEALEDSTDTNGPKLLSEQLSAPLMVESKYLAVDTDTLSMTSGESCDTAKVEPLPTFSFFSHGISFTQSHPVSKVDSAIPRTRLPSPRPSVLSSATSPSIYTVDSFVEYAAPNSRRRPSIFSRLRSSLSTNLGSNALSQISSIQPADFRAPSEQTERRFVDSIGIVCPGVSDRPQCAHPLAHFVSTFRICQPIEYTTALADHGLTYMDYCRLLTALESFLEEHVVEYRTQSTYSTLSLMRGSRDRFGEARVGRSTQQPAQRSTFFDTTEQLKKTRQLTHKLNQLLEAITFNVQARGVPVVICVSSYSLFAPHRISEAHVQILHAPRVSQNITESSENENFECRRGQRLSFIDPFTITASEQRSVSKTRPNLDSRSESPSSAKHKAPIYYHQSSHNRDRAQPWPLWPNAIPSRKRQSMNENADRYGVDPYFRAWMRANINSWTNSTTYAMYMIEQEDDPFVNRRLDYNDAASRGALFGNIIRNGSKTWQIQFPSAVNRARYEHNRRLECRKIIENGSRLRLVRFGFRYSIYPPHTPEMEELGLTKESYATIISKIDNIRTFISLSTKCPMSYMVATWNKIRRRSTEDALKQVSEYIRELNASQRWIVWTIEKIPGVYDRGFAQDRMEWEISAWNGEDPLELLMQLERWGIIESKLGVEDDE